MSIVDVDDDHTGFAHLETELGLGEEVSHYKTTPLVFATPGQQCASTKPWPGPQGGYGGLVP